MKMLRTYSLAIAFVALVVFTAVTVQGFMRLPYQIRFTLPAMNYWAVAFMALALPILLFWISLNLKEEWFRSAMKLVASLFILPCLAIAGCSALEAPHSSQKFDRSYELISEAFGDATIFRLYKTNCSATCGFGLDLREEREMFLGMKSVSPIWSLQPASKGRVVVEKSTVSVLHETNVLAVLPR